MSKNDGGPAFPCGPRKLQNGDWAGESDGLLLRDYFAAKALQGDWANSPYISGCTDEHLAEGARLYYRMADAMLKARED